MFQSLLVPLDGSHFSEQSIPTAAAIAGECGAALYLVHVHVPYVPHDLTLAPEFEPEGIELGPGDEQHREDEREYLERLGQGVSGVVEGGVRTELLDGPVCDALEEFADKADADLIVIASHGHTGVERLWLGSVTSALAHDTPRPLLVLRPVTGEDRVLGPTHFHHILVSLDGSTECEAILDPVRALGAMGATITLLHVVSEGMVLGARTFPLPPGETEGVMDRADEYLQSIARRIESDVSSVSIHVERAPSPVRGILRVADDLKADLIALSTHGYGGIRRAVLGSVADKVLRAAPQPVLLKRPE